MSTEESKPGPEDGDPPDEPKTEQPDQPEITPLQISRNPIERVVVWGLISAFVCLGFLEVRANLGYRKSVAALRAAEEESFEAPMGKKGIDDQLFRKDLDDFFWYSPGVTEEREEQWVVLTYRWFSLINLFTDDYEIAIELDSEKDDALVRRIYFPNMGMKREKRVDLDKKVFEKRGNAKRNVTSTGAGGKSARGKKKKSSRGPVPNTSASPIKKEKPGNKQKKPKNSQS